MNFNTVPTMNPMSEPMPALMACERVFPSRMAPKKAPMNGPMMMPNGRKNKPMIVPMRLPQLAHRP